ncbi:MAG: class I SAM-dependent methyltransferase [Solirubrobacteraceae bacterium]|nr:class I SAM-dependent methyltransferase [Solirubrobacteraceae bacterium]
MPAPRTYLTTIARRLVGARRLDELVRAEPVLRLVRELGGGTLLDAGSGSLGIADLLDERWRVTAVDRAFDDDGAWVRPPRTRAHRVVADVCALPFPDGAFDVVVAIDLVDRLAPGRRGDALRELGRVARRRVIVSSPAGPAALEADRRLLESLRRPPRWLVERVGAGLPYPADLEVPLRAWGLVRSFPSGSPEAHVRLARRELRPAGVVPSRLAARALARGLRDERPWARRALRRLRGGDAAPGYRTVVVAEIAASRWASSSSVSAA